jgi:HEAT repeat protein/putative zinc finger protein
MQCEEVREQFADYVIDALEGPTATLVSDHLSSCESCRTEAEELKALWANLGLIPAAEPTPQLRSRFQMMLQAYEHGMGQAPGKNRWESFNSWVTGWWPSRPALQLSLSLGLLMLGVVVGRQFQTVTTVPATQPNNEVAELRGELTQMRQLVALSLMQQQSASERLKGVNWSYQLLQPGGEVLTALLNTLMHDSNVNVRLATVDALRQFGDRPVVRRGVIEAMTRQESPMVQIALIDLAVDLREKESIATLRQLTQDQKIDDAVRDRAQKGLAELE